MKIQYSQKTHSFYPSDIDYGSALPDDVIDVSHSDFEQAIQRPTGYSFSFVDGKLVIEAPPSPLLASIKSLKLGELADAFSLRMGAIKAGYPDDEIQSWFQQLGEATAYTASATAATPLLSSMASARGITVADLAARILANSKAYSVAAGTLIGKRQKYEDAVNAAADAAAVAAISWID